MIFGQILNRKLMQVTLDPPQKKTNEIKKVDEVKITLCTILEIPISHVLI